MKAFILYIFAFFGLFFSPDAQTRAIGSTEGGFAVSDLGAASYTIPLAVRDGINGLQPALALSYNSNGGNGIMGMGWTLSGLSVITRVPENIYHDKQVDGVKRNASDRFALDGNRLICVYGNYGDGGSKYQTAVQSFRTIVANGQAGAGPESFTVTDQNGIVYEYRLSADSRAMIAHNATPIMKL
jgi:hypothetical protein